MKGNTRAKPRASQVIEEMTPRSLDETGADRIWSLPVTCGTHQSEIASMAGGTSTCETSIEKLVMFCRAASRDTHGVGGRGCFETNREEYHLRIGLLRASCNASERRIDNPHVCT